MRNIVNIGHPALLSQRMGRGVVPQPYLTEWCDANVSQYEVKSFNIYHRTRGPETRYGIQFQDDGDLLMFMMRWAGEFKALDGGEGKFPIGPYSEEEMKKSGPLPDLMDVVPLWER